MGMGTQHMVRDAKFLKEGVELLIFATPIRLEGDDFGVKFSFNESLEVKKNWKHVGSFLEKIDPREFAKIIDETHVICMPTNRSRGRSPNIRENEL